MTTIPTASRTSPIARRAIPAAALLGALAACTSLTGPEPSSVLRLEQPAPGPGTSALRLAHIDFYQDPVIVEVPGTMTAGVPAAVAVTTYGGGCVAEDTVLVEVAGLRADVAPYQRVHNPGPNGACTQELRITRRVASVTFAAPGLATVRVIGREAPGDALVIVERAVQVR